MTTRRHFLITTPLGLIAATRAASALPPRSEASVNAQATTPMSDAVRAELAPNGRLRAALNYSNFLLVSSRSPEHTGVR